jgi:hypothetical protein
MAMKFRSTLTNYAFEIAPETQDATALFLAPEVTTGIYTGYYKDFGDKQMYQAPTNARRGIGQKAQRLTFDVADKKFNLDAYGLDIPVDDQERKQAASLDPELLERQKIRYLIKQANNIHAKSVIDLAKSSTSYDSDTTISPLVSTSTTIQPTKYVDNAMQKLADKVGRLPNKVLMSVGAWNKIRNNQLLIQRLVGLSIAGVTVDQMKSLFLNPNCDVMVSAFVLDTLKPGAASNKSNYLGNDVWVFYADANPSPYDMSFMKTFRLDERGVSAVYQERDWEARSDVFLLDWYEEILVTGSALVERIQVT